MKDKIVERLLEEGSITAKEAIILLKETEVFSKTLPYKDMRNNEKVPYHEICGCTICNCTLANTLVDPNSSGNYSITPIYHTTSSECKNGPMCHCDGSCK